MAIRFPLLRLAGILCVASIPCFAVPIQWTLANVVFVGGATATGSFVFDADTNTYSAINIVATGSGSVPASTYIARHPEASASLVAFVTLPSGNLTGTRTLVLPQSGGALTNAGGTRTLGATAAEGECMNAGCTNASLNTRVLVAGGSIVGARPAPAQTPIPPTGMMAMVGVLLLLAVAYLRTRSKAAGTLAG